MDAVDHAFAGPRREANLSRLFAYKNIAQRRLKFRKKPAPERRLTDAFRWRVV
jgi:hypothetical protein